jgi:hypothetical protein
MPRSSLPPQPWPAIASTPDTLRTTVVVPHAYNFFHPKKKIVTIKLCHGHHGLPSSSAHGNKDHERTSTGKQKAIKNK